MIGADTTWEEIPDSGLVKKKYWYDVYKFDSEDQYNEWREWATDKLRKEVLPELVEENMNYLDLRYGMKYRYKKPGELL
jgi:hypothetical protein